VLSEMEEINLMRDTLNGEGASVTFDLAFVFYEMGYDAETLLSMIYDLGCTRSQGIWRIKRAMVAVKEGRATTIEAALEYT